MVEIMKRNALLIVFYIFFISAFFCGKKKEGEEMVIQSEMGQVDVTVPHVAWEKTLAILALTETSASPEEQMLSKMVMEGMTSRLSRIKGLKVIPFTSAETDRSGIDYVLTGKVEKENGRVRIPLEVMDVQQDRIIWREAYEEEAQSLYAVETSASNGVAGVLGLKVVKETGGQANLVSSQVLEGYVKAKSYLAGNTRNEIDMAVKTFKEVLRLDSTYVPAYLGLARSYLKIVENRWDANLVWLQLAQDVLIKAIRIDPVMAENYLEMGRLFMLRGDYHQAEKQFKDALRRNPNLEGGWMGLGQIYISFGLYEACLEMYERAMALNPTDENTALSRTMILIGLGQYDEAEETLGQAIRYHSDKHYLHSFLALILYYRGDMGNAQAEVEKGLMPQTYRPFSQAVQGMIYAKQGKLDEALGMLEVEVKPAVGNDASLATAVAAIYVLIGQKGQGIQWLKKAVSWGYKEYPWLDKDPNFQNLRGDPRFEEILMEMKRVWEANVNRYRDLGL